MFSSIIKLYLLYTFVLTFALNVIILKMLIKNSFIALFIYRLLFKLYKKQKRLIAADAVKKKLLKIINIIKR